MTVEVGRRFPLHAGSSSTCILAFLPTGPAGGGPGRPTRRADPADRSSTRAGCGTVSHEVLRTGVAQSDGERQAGAGSVAAPVFGVDGSVQGAISVCGPADRVGPAARERFVPLLVEAADRISRGMGWHGGLPGHGGRAMSDALAGLKVLDVSTLFAGPLAATMLGDFGADVIKVEHPRGDPVRSHGASKDGVGLWAKVVNRNKRGITLYLGSPEGQDVFRRLVADADVVIENFRPGTLERWGLGYPELVGGQPRSRPRPRHRVRADRPVRRTSGVRHPRRGDERVRRDHGGAGRSPDPAAVRPRRRHRRPGRRLRDDDGAARAGDHGAGPGRRPRHHRADPDPPRARSRRSGTPCSRSRSAPATGRPTTRRATPTSPGTAGGSRCRPARRASPSGSCGSSAVRS